MYALLLLGCATTPWGTWAFTLHVTAAVGDECTTTVTHNYTGAHVPVAADTSNPDWTQTSSSETSPQLFFARIDENGQGAMMIIGSEALPGSQKEDGTWLFQWVGSTDGDEENLHASGYDYVHHSASTSTVQVQGEFDNETFTGTWSNASSSRQKWDESDTWSDGAAAYVGETGATPVSSYLVLTDGAGVDYAASNTRGVYDCDSAGCTLSAEAVCSYDYDVDAQLTAFTSEDSRWTEDAGQPAGL